MCKQIRVKSAPRFATFQIRTRNAADLPTVVVHMLARRAPVLSAALRSRGLSRLAAVSHSLLPPQLPGRPFEDEADEMVLKIMHGMAVRCHAAGNVHSAVNGFRAVLKSRQAGASAKSPCTLHAMGNLAACLRQAGELAEAEGLAREQVACSERLLGAAHPDTLGAKSNLMAVLRDAGKYDDAEPLGLALLDDARLTLGPTHASTLAAQSNLAQIYLAQGRHKDAEPLIREDLRHSSLVHGAYHTETLVALSNLANVLTAQRKLNEAEPMMRKHVALCREVHGERHPHTLVAIHNLVELLRRQGGAEVEALLLLREYSDASASVLGERHPDSIDAAESHAALLVHLGRLPEAIQIVRKLHGDAHVWTISLLDKLVHRLCADGQPAAAEPYAVELVDATERALGADNNATLRSRLLLAAVQSKKTEEVKPYGAITYKTRIY